MNQNAPSNSNQNSSSSPMFLYSQHRPPKEPWPTWAKITLSFIAVGMVICLGMVYVGLQPIIASMHSQAQQTTTISHQKATTTTSPTVTQTTPATKKGSQSKAMFTSLPTPTNGPAAIGQPISNFLGSYGQPMNDLWKQGEYMWRQGTITASVYAGDHDHVNSILYDNVDGNGWSNLEAATTACRAFIPADSKYERTIDVSSGTIPATERVYYSATLATLLPASDFWDENANQMKPGTFAIVYTYDYFTDTNRVLNCSIQSFLQSK